jgi:hypothetical protein
MHKQWVFLLMSTLVLLFLGGSAPAGAAGVVDPYPPHSGFACAESSPLPTGVPAIHPYLPTIPAYTAEDVRHYVQQTHVHSGTGRVTVLRVLFLHNQDVCARLQGESTGFALETLVCFVELQGIFYPLSYPAGFQPRPSLYAYEVYDAQTGNLVMLSG